MAHELLPPLCCAPNLCGPSVTGQVHDGHSRVRLSAWLFVALTPVFQLFDSLQPLFHDASCSLGERVLSILLSFILRIMCSRSLRIHVRSVQGTDSLIKTERSLHQRI